MLTRIFAALICLGLISGSPGSAEQASKARTSQSLDELVSTERAFARFAVENGIRESFIAFFADDGVNFQPHPTITKVAMLKRPPTRLPLAFTLDWEPVYADVAISGDLGYTTGPYSLKDNSPQPKPTSHGYYFSIWKRQADLKWKVEVDCGISTPETNDTNRPKFRAALPGHYQSKVAVKLDAERVGLEQIEREFSADAIKRGLWPAYSKVLAIEARIHRNSLFPLTDTKAISQLLQEQKSVVSWLPIHVEVSSAGDFGYTYGSYESRESSTGKHTESGYYVHVWRRAPDAEWKLVLDTTSPLQEQN